MPRRYFSPPSPLPPPADASAELEASLNRINTFNPPVQTCSTGWRHAGLYAGPTSVAYLFFRLAQLYPDMTFKGQHLADWATAYLDLGQSYMHMDVPGGCGGGSSSSSSSSNCGVANEALCQLALRACLEHDASLARALCGCADVVLRTTTPAAAAASDEWLYGRAGYLYLLRVVRACFSRRAGDAATADAIDRTVARTVERMLAAEQPWTWHGKAYVGAVHGAIGIATQIVLSLPCLPAPWSSAIAAKLEPIIQAVVALQDPSTGNFPPTYGRTDDDRLVQFCHGAPGVVVCLQTILAAAAAATRPPHSVLLPLSSSLQAAMQRAIHRAQHEPGLLGRSLLTKDPCLCHGIPTNVFALVQPDGQFEQYLALTASAHLEADTATASAAWMRRAGRDSDFVGLYTGEAGRAWMWAVVDQMHGRGDRSSRQDMGIIGFNDL